MKPKLKSKKLFVIPALASIIPIMVIGLNLQIFAKNKTDFNITSYPENYYPTSYPDTDNDTYTNYTLDKQSIKFETKASSNVGKYSGEMYRKNLDSISEIKLDLNSSGNRQFVRIISVDGSNSTSTLNLLERFIFSNHGITTKSDQKVSKLGNQEVAQIAFSFTDEEAVVYEIFSAIKVGSLGWIITTTFTLDSYVDDILSSKNQKNISEYSKMIASLKPLKNVDMSNFMKLKDDTEIDGSIIKLNKQFNSKFNSSFK